MKRIRYATITLALDVNSEAEVCDAVNEILREQQRSFTPTSCLLDYQIDKSDLESVKPIDVADYTEGDAFEDRNFPENPAAVLIAVDGGVAEVVGTSGNVETAILDFDNLAGGSNPIMLKGELLRLAREESMFEEGRDFDEDKS